MVYKGCMRTYKDVRGPGFYLKGYKGQMCTHLFLNQKENGKGNYIIMFPKP